METLRIIRLDDHPAVRFAATELKRYLTLATRDTLQIQARKRYRAASRAIWLGVPPDLPATELATDSTHDGFVIAMTTDGGYIAGSNPRSVLFGVYRYLETLGCRWPRPGSDGEIIPSLDAPLQAVHTVEHATYAHRGVCIEGAVSYENVHDMVDWLPKLGFNAYFIQFREAFNFFQRWYEHVGNPLLRGRRFSSERAARLTTRLRAEIKRRGLDLHMVGHGWTCEPFGIPGPGWFQHEGPIPEEARPHLAQIDGRRDLWHGVALNTNLCYGNPETRRIIVQAIVDYARTNHDVDILHFWLADGSNNHCECPLCVDHRPADLYVRMLNELDAALIAAGLDTRVVFLVYVDLLWPPVVEQIRNPSRFILMFAPITRSYSSAFATAAANDVALPPFERNRLEFPRDPASNIAFLRSWQEMFTGDGFDFDYHLMWDHYKDPGQMASARVLHEDIQRLRDIGLNGLVSCQVQRVFFPSATTMVVMGRTLWNREADFDGIVADHLRAAFGEDGPAVKGFLEQISELFAPPVLRGEGDADQQQTAAAAWPDVAAVVADMRPRTAAGRTDARPAVARSWDILERYLDYCLLLADALLARYNATPDAPAKAWAVFNWARAQEKDLQPVLDLFELQHTLGPVLGIDRKQLESRH